MYPRRAVSKEDIGVPGGGIRNDEFRDERLSDKSVRLAQSEGLEGGGLQIVTSHGSANFQKAMGSKREAMCWYSVGSLRDFGHVCIMSWTGKSWSCTSSMLRVFSNMRRWDGEVY